MQRRGVVVVIVRAPAVPAPLVEFADLRGDLAAIVLRVEDRDAIGRERDGAAQEAVLDRDHFLRRHRRERDLPRIRARVVLRQRHLLLPRGDADHHVVRGQPVAFDEKKTLIPAHIHSRRERRERRRLLRLAGGGSRRGNRLRGLTRRGRLCLREEEDRRPYRPVVVRVRFACDGIMSERGSKSPQREDQKKGRVGIHDPHPAS